jgi:hypothetical protein
MVPADAPEGLAATLASAKVPSALNLVPTMSSQIVGEYESFNPNCLELAGS